MSQPTISERQLSVDSTEKRRRRHLGWMLQMFDDLPQFRSLVDGVKMGAGAQLVHGLSDAMDSCVVASLHRGIRGATLVICSGPAAARRLRADMATWLPTQQVAMLPPMELLPHLEATQGREAAPQRLQALGCLAQGKSVVVITCPAGLQRKLPPRGRLRQAFLTLSRGETLDREDLLGRLTQLNYRQKEAVMDRGQFAVRGGIIDIFPPISQRPLRLELFGDSIDSLRVFDPETQRSVRNVDSAVISPADEIFAGLGDIELADAVQQLEDDADEQIAGLRRRGRQAAADHLEQRIQRQKEMIKRRKFGSLDVIFPYLSGSMDTVFDYLPEGSCVAICDPAQAAQTAQQESDALAARHSRLIADGVMLPRQMTMEVQADELYPGPARVPRVYLSSLLQDVDDPHLDNVTKIAGRPAEAFYGQWEVFVSHLRQWRSSGSRVVILADTLQRKQRVESALKRRDVSVVNKPSDTSLSPYAARLPVVVSEGKLSEGFEIPALDAIVLTADEIFGATQRTPYQVPKKERRGIVSYEELNEGDYVVHRSHGIGQYLGLSCEEVEGVQRDYLLLRYAEGDRLYVPVESIDMVQKYVGAEGKRPRLYRLDSGEWRRVKKRVRKSVRDMAEELLELYATRRAVSGHAFSPDSMMQRKFEAGFPYQETSDQLVAAEEIKEAMQQPHPMDYLLCGDVGYGKTEVAFRAAFKAILDSKQVAFLVPTTVLAQQHYHTARQRFDQWPVRVRMLSRFRSRSEQAETVNQLRRGSVDLVVGTHRLLKRDVQFDDLGLVIVDEEHRFGVADKERLKQLKKTVDVLTLTATPIPRTLHMALAGLRDMSVIGTPPADRLPVSTYVMEYDEQVLADAVQRELHRGGQIFYVHNRVRTIAQAKRRAQNLAPEADVVVAHGQMPERQLESIMERFVTGAHDILVCTTIIESGLDIPNVNTLIVENSDMLGLAQLYQLRGRVGRSDRLAYAYLTYQRGKVLTEMAAKRLHALREFTQLGSGLRLARRDLQLRGAGDVLGAEQHGHMVAVGFDLYSRLLEDAVQELRGEKKPPLQKPDIQLQVDAYLPSDYIPSSAHRIEMYRDIAEVESVDEAADLLDEMIDRFGDPPRPAVNLIYMEKLKVLGGQMGVMSISRDSQEIKMQLMPEEQDSVDWDQVGEEFGLRPAVRERKQRTSVSLRPRRASGNMPTGTHLLQFLEEILREIP